MAVFRLIALWALYMFFFMVVGAIISIIAAEIDQRKLKTSGMAALGFWIIPMFIYWMLCAAVAVVFILGNISPRGIFNTFVIFIPGVFLGSAAVFLVGPLWLSRNNK